jgi:hypothetical protein
MPHTTTNSGLRDFAGERVLARSLWLLLGMLFRLPTLAVTSRYAEVSLCPNNRRMWVR